MEKDPKFWCLALCFLGPNFIGPRLLLGLELLSLGSVQQILLCSQVEMSKHLLSSPTG